MLSYPAKIKKDSLRDYILTFRKPASLSITFTNMKDVQEYGLKLLLHTFECLISNKTFLPEPTKVRKDEVLIQVPLLVELKLSLTQIMLLKNICPAELARLMKVKPQEVTRILNLYHKTKLETLEKAYTALGYGLDFKLRTLS